jgi:hypothetical protein
VSGLLIAEIDNRSPSSWRTVDLDVPNRKYRTPKVYEQKVCLQRSTYRQLFVKDLGHDLPTISPSRRGERSGSAICVGR